MYGSSMVHICSASFVFHAEVNFTLLSIGDDITHGQYRSILDK